MSSHYFSEVRNNIDLSLNEIVEKKQRGLLSEKAYSHLFYLWTWSAFRASSFLHDRFYKRMGSEAYWRRIDRAKKIVEQIKNSR